ncbi:MAG: DNA replication/repair protein RecF [Ruminococcaceae bacterium]|nr:DNA replication/repair protein RecF [Oscillospiraceae bacterium]
MLFQPSDAIIILKMRIKNISIENFRNIKELNLEFDDVNIIWGENAQGKTNLIEAIYLFTGLKSFRGAKDNQLIMMGEEQSRLKLDFEGSGREQYAEIDIKNKRVASLNGVKKKSTTSLSDEIKAVIFSPVHLNMIKDGPSERRKFIDGALCQIKSNYRNLLKEYNRCLNQRNILLKDLKNNPELDSLLYIWNKNLAISGAKIVYQRLKYIEALSPYVKDIFSGISSGNEEIELKYQSFEEFPADIDFIEKKLLRAFENNKYHDMMNKATSSGPHRDDIEILINGMSARIYGSQGQQRSCVLALKLAEASLLEQITKKEPIALLDDVMSELDEKRQDYILNHIKNRQVFITCCDKETILRLKKGKTFHIEKGKLID